MPGPSPRRIEKNKKFFRAQRGRRRIKRSMFVICNQQSWMTKWMEHSICLLHLAVLGLAAYNESGIQRISCVLMFSCYMTNKYLKETSTSLLNMNIYMGGGLLIDPIENWSRYIQIHIHIVCKPSFASLSFFSSHIVSHCFSYCFSYSLLVEDCYFKGSGWYLCFVCICLLVHLPFIPSQSKRRLPIASRKSTSDQRARCTHSQCVMVWSYLLISMNSLMYLSCHSENQSKSDLCEFISYVNIMCVVIELSPSWYRAPGLSLDAQGTHPTLLHTAPPPMWSKKTSIHILYALYIFINWLMW
jgi:hypothetical protein